MKIAFLITKSNWGGAQKYVYELSTGLKADNFEIKVIAGGNGPLIDRLKNSGIDVIAMDSLSNDIGLKKEFYTFRDLWKIIRQERPDVLHVNSSKAGIMGALVGRILRVPRIIFTAHGWAFNEDRPLYQKVILKYMHWMTIILAHHTIAVSQNIASAFDGWLGVDGKITVIYNGVKQGTGYAKNGARQVLSDMFPELKKVLAEKHVYFVGTIAELHPVKNIDIAINAINELVGSPVRFVYAVIGDGRERERLENKINESGLSNNVFLLGHIPDAFQYIKAFDAFLLPSRSEALAYVLLEAGLQESPVIATAVGGIPEIVEDMKSGILVQSGKSSEIAHAIKFYNEHTDIAKQYAKNLNSIVKQKFTLERMVKETENVYEKGM